MTNAKINDESRNEVRPYSSIRHLRLHFTGCKYDVSLDNKIRQSLLNDGIDPIIRGQLAPAAGASLAVDIAISVATGIAADLIIDCVKAIILRVRNAAGTAASCECSICKTTIETDSCDYVVSVNTAAGISFEDIDFDKLISEMMRFSATESATGNAVNRIETPCDLPADKDDFIVATNGVGSFSLWLVTYRIGRRWPSCLYDAANDKFIPLDNRRSIRQALGMRDEFDHPEE